MCWPSNGLQVHDKAPAPPRCSRATGLRSLMPDARPPAGAASRSKVPPRGPTIAPCPLGLGALPCGKTTWIRLNIANSMKSCQN